MVYGLAAAILLPVLVQGGFYPTAFLIPGAALAGAGALRRGRALERGERALWALALLYLLASLVRGYSASSLAQACLPACCGAFCTCISPCPRGRRAVCWTGWRWPAGSSQG